jgi:hypothetical protein
VKEILAINPSVYMKTLDIIRSDYRVWSPILLVLFVLVPCDHHPSIEF